MRTRGNIGQLFATLVSDDVGPSSAAKSSAVIHQRLMKRGIKTSGVIPSRIGFYAMQSGRLITA